LSTPIEGVAKDEAGGYAMGQYMGNVRRKANLVSIGSVVLDFDESGVNEVTGALGLYPLIVHETFSSTCDAPRCRALVLLAEPIDSSTYETLHRVMRAKLRATGLPPDEGAKDCSRLSYTPVRRAGTGYEFRVTQGKPLDARAVLAAQPSPPPPSAVARPLPDPNHADAYVRGALRRAADEVSAASPGGRHYALCREAFALARLGVSEYEIHAALLPRFVSTAGEARRREGVRTIADAIRARRGAA
jgi:hypothetical protein